MTGLSKARSILAQAAGLAQQSASSREARAALAEDLARALLEAASELRTDAEARRGKMLSRLTHDPLGQGFTTQLTDRAYRAEDPTKTALQVRRLTQRFGVPQYLSPAQRAQLWLGARAATLLPRVITRAVHAQIRAETTSVLWPSHADSLTSRLHARHAEHTRVNLNKLGEALLGEQDAESRVAKYIELVSRPDVDTISVKVSSIASQLSPLAFEHSVSVLSERLARIYTASLAHAENKRPVVMLDMEAYRHVELTLAAMREALSTPALRGVRAGVVLQAYLPEASTLLGELMDWAEARSERGALPIRLRLVKGANLAAERVESAKAGVPVPMYAHKVEVDANYKLLLERVITQSSLASIQLGVASHNVFDIAYALVLARERGVGDAVGIEMLEGMADALRRALVQLAVDVLVYVPICEERELNTAIAYLMRRLEENTSHENFLSASFDMRPGDAAFERERARFFASLARMDALSFRPHRADSPAFDRNVPATPALHGTFENEPDTDFSRAENRAWIASALRQLDGERIPFCSIIAGRPRTEGPLLHGDARHRHLPFVQLADAAAIEEAVGCAAADPERFSQRSLAARAQLLSRIAQKLREARGELIAYMVHEAHKRVPEADAEVSEAIDFAEYYRHSFLALSREVQARFSARGVVLVTPPWNFPLAIPAGGVLAALMAGNRVLLKPALETPRIAARMVELFYEAGVPRTALQLIVCEDEVASALVRDPRVDSVVLTGATDTARLFQGMRPGLHLLAETGGKNCILVSAMCDRDQAIADAVTSAFGHAGQKCSAASLLILESELYDDPRFLETLRDAVQSLPVGSAEDPKSVVTPLIAPPRGALLRELTSLAAGESWLVEPRIDRENPQLVSPGVKLGVQASSHFYRTELFGPVLGVMRARDLEHALELANGTGYGLTAGLQSLDEVEQAEFVRRMQAGNLYINRSTTGAIVERQPFGGFGKSGFGPGAKAGGPNYVAQLCKVEAARVPAPTPASRLSPALRALFERAAMGLPSEERSVLLAMLIDYAEARERHFLRVHDPQAILGQQNAFRYLREPNLVLRVEADAERLDAAASALAVSLLGARVPVSIAHGFPGFKDTSYWGQPVRLESQEALEHSLREQVRVRLLGTRSAAHDALSAKLGAHIADAKVLPCGRLELLHYLREQSVSVDYHRYGQIAVRRPEVVQPWK